MILPVPPECYCTRCRRPIPDDVSRRQGVCDDCLAVVRHVQSVGQPNYLRWLAACAVVFTAVSSLWLINDIAVQRRSQKAMDDALRAIEKAQRIAQEQTNNYAREQQNRPSCSAPAPTSRPTVELVVSDQYPGAKLPSTTCVTTPTSPRTVYIPTSYPGSTYRPVYEPNGEIDLDGNLAWRKAAAVMVEDFIRQSNPGRPWPASTRETQPLPAWCEPGWSGMIRRPSHQYIFGARGPIGAKGAGLMDFTHPASSPVAGRP